MCTVFDPFEGQVSSWKSNTFPTCGRESFLGSVGKITARNGQQIGDAFFLFNMKKIFYFCDVFVPDKAKRFYKKISNKKTGVFGQCKCNPNGQLIPYPQKTCSITFAGKFLGKYGVMAKKSQCGTLMNLNISIIICLPITYGRIQMIRISRWTNRKAPSPERSLLLAAAIQNPAKTRVVAKIHYNVNI